MVKHPRVYIDVSIGGRGGGRVVFELFYDLTPRAAENFRGLCTGEYGKGQTTKKKLSYEGCTVFRSTKDMFIQSGDFQFNNGDGGESIYGGTFNDEDFSRRHTQAGVLSMANKGRNSNGSQFFITLKRCQKLDGKNLVIGQVVDGMDVIRAIGKVPTDKDERPRVPITIVGCGQAGTKVARAGDDPYEQLSSQISKLQDGVAPPEDNAAVKAKAILKGGQGGAAVESVGGSSSSRPAEEEAGGQAPPRNAREQKLFELRMRMNACRTKNSKEVVEEQKRNSDPDYAKKQAEARSKKAIEDEAAGKDKDKDAGDGTLETKPGQLPKGKEYLGDTLESVEMRDAKKKRKVHNAFGWDVFNQDSLYRAHDKRLKHMQFDEKAYQEQRESIESQSVASMSEGFGHQPSEEGKNRLQEAMEKILDKKKDWSRRRMHIAEEDATYVSDRNRHFNKKLERSFNVYTEETRQNLERGTAL